ncbi:MAG TPA: hypothetical protein VMZ31_13130 [Phycisphaerae bacterium]|nr:hypothetical protein [Phycisphaerae bacterium]
MPRLGRLLDGRWRIAGAGRWLMVSVLLAMAPGCVWYDAGLAIESPPGSGSFRGGKQVEYVHVGQPTTFSFVIRGVADYAEVFFGGAAPPVTVKPVNEGAFRFEQSFERPTDPNEPVTVAAAAYLIRGAQDRMYIRGNPITRERGDDVPDRRCAKASMTLCVYQSRVEVPIPADEAPAVWGATRLLLQHPDGQTVTVYPAQGQSEGFAVNGPGDDDCYLVTYHPRYEQLSAVGATEAVVSGRDPNGRLRTWQGQVSGPPGRQ